MNILTATTGAADLVNISIANAGIVALLGYGVVFFGLILLMCVITLLGKAFMAAEAKQKAAAAAALAAAAPAAAAPVVNAEPAPASAGKLKLHDVEPKTAAMLMAIVADKMGKPINELRFISIKEVK